MIEQVGEPVAPQQGVPPRVARAEIPAWARSTRRTVSSVAADIVVGRLVLP